MHQAGGCPTLPHPPPQLPNYTLFFPICLVPGEIFKVPAVGNWYYLQNQKPSGRKPDGAGNQEPPEGSGLREVLHAWDI